MAAEEKVVKPNAGAGLRGQSAGETEISTVGAAGNNLRYRGYNVQDLAADSTFYEVAYLILRGRLPTQTELDRWKKRLKGMRGIPQPLKDTLERIPADAHPMDVLRTGVSISSATSSRKAISATSCASPNACSLDTVHAAVLVPLLTRQHPHHHGNR